MNLNEEKTLLADIAAVASPAVSEEFIATVRMRCRAQLDVWKERAAAIDAAMVDHIEATGRPIVIGSIEYRAGNPPTTKNRPEAKARTLRELFDVCGGDIDAVAECLYADPYKMSEAKGRLSPQVFAECFETTTKVKLIEGKAKPQLIANNMEFSR